MKTCIICEKKGHELFGVQGKYLWKCDPCDLTWTQNFTLPSYSRYHWDDTYVSCDSLFNNAFQRLYTIAQSHGRKGKLFEIGASVGNLLGIFASNGWDVSGIEPSRSAVKVAKKRGLNVSCGFFENAKIPSQQYDLVVINQTLEHVESPLIVLRKIKRILKKDGVVLIGVPNFGSLSARILRQHWYYIIPEEHKWHFSPTSLEKLVRKSGLDPIDYLTASGIFDYASPIGELWNSFIGMKKRFFVDFFTLIPSYILTKLNCGTGLVFVAIRRGDE